MQVTDRLEELERRTDELAARLARVEDAPPPPPPPRTVGPVPPVRPRPAVPAPAPVPVPPRASLEDVLGGRVLAWAGGLAVLVAIVLFFAIAVTRGWIGEGARTVLGGLASLALLAAGAWLHERRGASDAARAATAAGVGGLFATACVAGAVYALVPVAAALVGAVAVGAVATALALRWDSRGIAALGILGGLAAPVALGAPTGPATLALLWVTGAAAAAVLVRRGWDDLAGIAFVVLAAQWAPAVLDADSVAERLVALAAFGALGAVLAAAPGPTPAGAAGLLALNALLLGAAGWVGLDDDGRTGLADAWLVALAAAHLGAGAALRARARTIAAVALGLGVVVADVALARLLDGAALAVAWSALGVLFAALLGRLRTGAPADETALAAGLAAHVALAIGHTLLVTAPPGLLALADPDLGTAVPALISLSTGLVAAGTLVARRPAGALALHGLAVAAVAHLLAVVLDGPALTAALAGEAIALARTGAHGTRAGAAALALTALAHALTAIAPPLALRDGLADPLGAAAALGAVAIAVLAVARRTSDEGSDPFARGQRVAGAGVAALVLLHLASAALVTAVGPGQAAQAALSGLWGAVGVVVLVAGLWRDRAALRAGALALLLGAAGKVLLHDLAALDAMARVASFLVLGLLLLLGAFAWQRMRPPVPEGAG